MSGAAQLIGGVLGGVIGFFVGGGIPGAIAGFSVGFGAGGIFFGPSIEGAPEQDDPFQVTGADVGKPIDIVFGTRVVPGNIIYFDFANLETEEITEDAKGKGGIFSSPDVPIEVRYFAPVHISLALGNLGAAGLISVNNAKGEDWLALNDDYGGSPLQISTGLGTDFGYKPEATPLPGTTTVYSPRFYLGSNSKSMTPLEFKIDIAVVGMFSDPAVAALGDPRSGLTTGVNPASVALEVLTQHQSFLEIPTPPLDLVSFQAAYDRFKAEDRGFNIHIDNLVSGKSFLQEIEAHTASVFRSGLDGKLQLYPIRTDNYTAIPVAEKEVKEILLNAPTWFSVDNSFVANFPDEAQNYQQADVFAKNESAIALTGREKLFTTNFSYFTDRRNAQRRLDEMLDRQSFPSPVITALLSKKFHKTRIQDVFAITHRRYDFIDKKFRVVEIQDADLGKEGIRIKAVLEHEPLTVAYNPPSAGGGGGTTPTPAPQDVVQVSVLGQYWPHPHGPDPDEPDGGNGGGPSAGGPPIAIPGSPNAICPLYLDDDDEYPGYLVNMWSARGSGTNLGALFENVHSKQDDLPINLQARTPYVRPAYAFTTLEIIQSGDWSYAGVKRLKLQFVPGWPKQTFNLSDQDAVDANGFFTKMETGRWVLIIGNTEMCLWRASTALGGGVYEFEGVCRGANKEYLYGWPVGTPVMIVDKRPAVKPNGIAYSEWAHRFRGITQADYNDVALLGRIRSFVQGIGHLGQFQGPSEGIGGPTGITWEDRASTLTVGLACNLYPPANERASKRGPMPACQAFIRGSDVEERAWYGAALGSVGDWIVEYLPFPDDLNGLGDRCVFDDWPAGGAPEKGYEHRPWIQTCGTFLSFVPSMTGKTMRLWVTSTNTNPLMPGATILRTVDYVHTGVEGAWPAFIYTVAQQTADGVNADHDLPRFWVSTLGLNGQPCRPRLVDKIGTWVKHIDPTYISGPGSLLPELP